MLKILNTLSGEKEEFKSITDNVVGIYSCGPTVYGKAHIGNMRSYIFADILHKTLEYLGYKVRHVVNITDVGHLTSDEDEGEDKMEKGARLTGKSPYDVAREYENLFWNDLLRLNIKREEFLAAPRATEHIKEQLAMIKTLTGKGFTYETSDGIYFDTSKFKEYGKLSKQSLEEKLAGARIDINDEKKNPTDFALWKFCVGENLNHTMRWDFEGNDLHKSEHLTENENRNQKIGFPGWHIECSAMSIKYLGDRFDIHTGGIDHIPVHHENEIAQSESALGHPFVNYWMHNEFVLVDNGKMSKSLGNVYSLDDLKEKFDAMPLAFRYLCLLTHYRTPLNFTKDAIEAAKVGWSNLRHQILLLTTENDNSDLHMEIVKKYQKEFADNIENDLNTAEAMGTLYKALANDVLSPKEKISLCVEFDKVLDLDLTELIKNLYVDPEKEPDLNKKKIFNDIKILLDKREEFRKAKQFDKADEIRLELEKMGYIVEDTAKGPIVYKRME